MLLEIGALHKVGTLPEAVARAVSLKGILGSRAANKIFATAQISFFGSSLS